MYFKIKIKGDDFSFQSLAHSLIDHKTIIVRLQNT